MLNFAVTSEIPLFKLMLFSMHIIAVQMSYVKAPPIQDNNKSINYFYKSITDTRH